MTDAHLDKTVTINETSSALMIRGLSDADLFAVKQMPTQEQEAEVDRLLEAAKLADPSFKRFQACVAKLAKKHDLQGIGLGDSVAILFTANDKQDLELAQLDATEMGYAGDLIGFDHVMEIANACGYDVDIELPDDHTPSAWSDPDFKGTALN